jgi:hypothetical protein
MQTSDNSISPGQPQQLISIVRRPRELVALVNTTAYPEVLMRLDKVLDGPPKVRVSTVINSTVHKIAAGIAA